MTIALTLAEAFERAKGEAPGIVEGDFLKQLYAHLRSGRIVASAFACEIAQDNPQSQRAWRYTPRTAGDMQRQDIPAVEWAELAIHLESETAQTWGHDRSPKWTRDGGDGDPVWGNGYFGGAPVYTELRLIDENGDFKKLWSSGAGADGSPSWTDDELRSWLRDKERDLGHRPPVRTWKENDELMAGRGVTKQRFETVWRALYPAPEKGRRREEMPQERPKEKITSPRAP